jgi:hypothetical protein
MPEITKRRRIPYDFKTQAPIAATIEINPSAPPVASKVLTPEG